MKQRLLLLAALVVLACTTVDYESPQFAAKTRDHQTIGILPFEIVLTGRMPSHLGPEQVARIEEVESLAFQASLYDRLLNRSSAGRNRPILVEIQPVRTTNRILADHQIGVRETWEMSAEDAARLLGVDAVIRTSVHKNRYLSDLASLGVNVGLDILLEATSGGAGPILPPGLTKTYDILAESVLVDGDDGHLLWKVAVQRETDWSRPANDVVVGITKKLAKKFPYRS